MYLHRSPCKKGKTHFAKAKHDVWSRLAVFTKMSGFAIMNVKYEGVGKRLEGSSSVTFPSFSTLINTCRKYLIYSLLQTFGVKRYLRS